MHILKHISPTQVNKKHLTGCVFWYMFFGYFLTLFKMPTPIGKQRSIERNDEFSATYSMLSLCALDWFGDTLQSKDYNVKRGAKYVDFIY